MQAFKFNLGSNVFIRNRDREGIFGIVDKIYPVDPEDNINEVRYRVAFPTGYIITGESNLISIEEYESKLDGNISSIQTFNIFDYLSEDEIKRIVTERCKNAVTEKIDSILKVRQDANISLVDQIISNVAKEYADKLYPDVNPDVLDIIKDIINKKPENEDDYDNFRYQLNYRLQDVVKEYIEKNKEYLFTLIKDSVESACKTLAMETFISKLINAMDFKQIILDIIKESE